ncbi:serine hydrolase domain-containing protein [Polyangium sp. 6x1]|uniref:serine hydrolase domain-containing protein n=1 Tax=Polyangium sp. 6x1 TaxID=3042689 RepID=UPI00248211BE|nr:serine hydrolase domain-containing protein [Polyangium sp. 6x1]MDI1451730.1 serine hydrolase domain-containing protein [Polyangium sp. 6x1]
MRPVVTHTPPPATTEAASSAGPTSAAQEPHVANVLRGLRPFVEIAGRPPVRWTLEERMAHHHVPGVSIAVIEGGRIAWARGAGVKTAGSADPKDAVTPETLFQAGSISKPVSATAMLRLVERGTLELDTDVNRYLETWKVPDNEHTEKEKVTLRRLASHTAGLTNHGFPGYERNQPIPTLVQILNGTAPANTGPVRVDAVPGSISRYSGGGTLVMQLLMTDVTGKSFPALMQELVFGPAGMTHSTFEQPLAAARAGEAASAHLGEGKTIPGGWHVYPEMAPAGLWTTASDLARWAIAIADARAGRPKALLSQAMAEQMLTAVKDGIGLGPYLSGSGRSLEFGHGGSTVGFVCAVTMYPEIGVGAVVMTNNEEGGASLLREIQLALAAEYGWPDTAPMRVTAIELSAASAAGVAGSYVLQDGSGGPFGMAEVKQEGGRLVMLAPRLPQEELIPQSETEFVMGTLGWRVTFKREAGGKATGMTVNGGGMVVEGTRKP